MWCFRLRGGGNKDLILVFRAPSLYSLNKALFHSRKCVETPWTSLCALVHYTAQRSIHKTPACAGCWWRILGVAAQTGHYPQLASGNLQAEYTSVQKGNICIQLLSWIIAKSHCAAPLIRATQSNPASQIFSQVI